MIKPTCDVIDCGLELNEFGGILLSPPDSEEKVRKFHICFSCYEKIARKFIDTSVMIVDK